MRKQALLAGLPFLPLPVLVYQMGKVGSSTIFHTLRASGIPAAHVHVLLPENVDKWVVKKRPNRWEVRFRRILSHRIREGREPVRLVTLVRDPIGQNFSSYFQNFGRTQGDRFGEEDWVGLSADEIIRQYREGYPKTTAVRYFERELMPMTGIDIYRQPFPHEQGYQVLRQGRFSLLVLHVETPDRVKLEALNTFLGTKIPALVQRNHSLNKPYASLYAESKRRLKLPRGTVTRLLDSAYCRHFFTEAERRHLFDRWAEGEGP